VLDDVRHRSDGVDIEPFEDLVKLGVALDAGVRTSTIFRSRTMGRR
jgi:hypothetical protein